MPERIPTRPRPAFAERAATADGRSRGCASASRLLLTQRTLGAAALRSSCLANSSVGDQRYPSVGRGPRAAKSA